MPDQIIHELKNGLEPRKEDNQQPEVDAVTRKLFNDVHGSMVKIKCDDGSGSGFFVTADGDVATDAHVVLGSKHVSVITDDGVEHKAQIAKLDDVNDLAIVHIVDGNLPKDIKPLNLGSSANLTPDQPVWAFGHPAGWDPLFVSPGYFRHKETGQGVLDVENDDVQEHAKKVLAQLTPKEKADADAELKKPMLNAEVNIQKGNSGGALLDKDGNVIGITDLSNLRSNSDFTPVETLVALMNDKTPKFNFTYKDIGDGKLTLTDISRTNGEPRAPFVDNIIVMGDINRRSPIAPGITIGGFPFIHLLNQPDSQPRFDGSQQFKM